jgi:hypothetical protein
MTDTHTEALVELAALAMQNAELNDGDEGNTYRLFDLLGFSGENKAVMITRQLARAAIEALPARNDELTPANRDCLAKAKPGEPMFIILGRDPDGGNIVRLWAQRRFDAGDTEHAGPVFAIADAMDAWRDDGHLPESAPDASAYLPIARNDERAAYREGLLTAARTVRRYMGDHLGENSALMLDVDDGIQADKPTLAYVAESLERRAERIPARNDEREEKRSDDL